MEQKPQSSEKILKKLKRERTISDNELEESIARLRVPVSEISPEKNGKIQGAFEGRKLDIEYKELDQKSMGVVAWASILSGVRGLEDYGDWREVTGFTLGVEGLEKIDFLKIAPKGYKLYFNPDKKLTHGYVLLAESAVMIIGNISTFESVLTILHEVGHLWDEARLNALGVTKLTDDHKRSTHAEKLRRERAASAFAFKKLRSITKNPQLIKDSINFLKHFALQDYYTNTHIKIQQEEYLEHELRNDFDQGTMDLEEAEQQFYDDWLKWKKTPMYRLWKSQRPDMDEMDEYGHWREWLKESGHNYWKDLGVD